ncbi:hypothetical protein MBLNU457_5181t1 [Dothideomycetes sp. NU457]
MDIPSQQECVIEFFRRNGHSQTSAKSLKAAALHHVVEYMTIKRLDESKPTVNDRPTTETPVTTGTSVKTENVSSESNVALQLTLRNAPAVSTAILTDMLDPPTDRFAATAATTSRQSMSDELADSPQSTQSVALKRKLTELEEKVIPESGHVPEKKRTSIGKAIIQDDSHDGATADGAFAATVFSTSEREDTVRYPDTAQLNALLSGLELGASCLDEDESSLTRSIRVQYSEHSECPIATVGFKLAKTRAPEQVSVSSSLAPPTMARPLGAGEAAISTSKVDEPTDYIYEGINLKPTVSYKTSPGKDILQTVESCL